MPSRKTSNHKIETKRTDKSSNLKSQYKAIELSAQLQEREKELKCIYCLSDLIAAPGKSLDEIFNKTTDLIPPSFQYPENTCARLLINGKVYKTKNYKRTKWKQTANIFVQGKKHGTIEVGFISGESKIENDPFLKEEYDLLKVIAERMGQVYEAKQSERALKESETKFRSLISNIPGIIYRCALDENWTMYYISEAILDVSGYPTSDFIMNKVRSYASIIHPEDVDHVNKVVRAGVKDNQAYTIDYRIINKDATVRYVYEKGMVVYGRTKKDLWLDGVIFDITETVELKEKLYQTQKMDAFSHLVSGVAHNIENLLKTIQGCAEISIDYINEHDPLFVGMKEINRSAREAENLMQQLLVFGRKQILKPKNFNINQILKKFENKLTKMVGPDTDLNFQFSPHVDLIKMDLNQFETIISNLTNNACDAMKDAGTITIKTRNAHLDDSYFELPPGVKVGNYVLLTFSDTGLGMDIKVQSKIFDPFFTTKEGKHNIGLGLSTVYGIVKEYDGHIMFESEKNKGTTIKIFLPAINDE